MFITSGWLWIPFHMKYEWMMVAIYFSLGVVLLMAAGASTQRLLQQDLLFKFCVYGAYAAHATVMLIEALNDLRHDWQHLMPYGDVCALYIFAVSLYWAYRRSASESQK
jgi:hypothetical protein